MPRLVFDALPLDAAVRELAKAANAEPQYRPQVRMLIDYMVAAGLVTIDGDQVKADPEALTAAPKRGKTELPTPEPQVEKAPPQEAGRPMPLLLQGLLEKLPRGGKWTWAEAKQWLAYAESTFQMVYEFEDENPSTSRAVESGLPPSA